MNVTGFDFINKVNTHKIMPRLLVDVTFYICGQLFAYF